MGSAGPRLKHGDSLPTEIFVLDEHKWRQMQRARGRREPLNFYTLLQTGEMYLVINE